MGGGCELSLSCLLLFAGAVSVHSCTATFVAVRLGVRHLQREEAAVSQSQYPTQSTHSASGGSQFVAAWQSEPLALTKLAFLAFLALSLLGLLSP